MLYLVPCEPDGREAAGAEFVHNFISPIIVVVAQVNRMEAPEFVPFQVFAVEVDEKEAKRGERFSIIIMLVR